MQIPIGLTVTCIRIQFENILSSLLLNVMKAPKSKDLD